MQYFWTAGRLLDIATLINTIRTFSSDEIALAGLSLACEGHRGQHLHHLWSKDYMRCMNKTGLPHYQHLLTRGRLFKSFVARGMYFHEMWSEVLWTSEWLSRNRNQSASESE